MIETIQLTSTNGTAAKRATPGPADADRTILASDVRLSTDVYTEDGAHLGKVREVWAKAGAHGHIARTRSLLADYGPIEGTSSWFATPEGYIEVRKSRVPLAPERRLIPLRSILSIQGDYVVVQVEAVRKDWLDASVNSLVHAG